MSVEDPYPEDEDIDAESEGDAAGIALEDSLDTGEPDAFSDSQAQNAARDFGSSSPQQWVVSICFWSALLVAAAAYGAVALAPKLATWNVVRHEYCRNALQLIQLEDDVDYLERVSEALESDPEFLKRLAGPAEATRPGEGYIPVSGDLLFGYEYPEKRMTLSLPEKAPFDDIISPLAANRKLRRGLLIFAAGLTVFAFTFLNDAGSDVVYAMGRTLKFFATIPVRRYVGHAPSKDQDQEESDTDSA